MKKLLGFFFAFLLPLAAQTDAPPATSDAGDFERVTESNRDLLDLLKKQQAVLEDIQHDRSLQSQQIAHLEARLDLALQRNEELQIQISKLQTGGVLPTSTPPSVPSAIKPAVTEVPPPAVPPPDAPVISDPPPAATAASFLPTQQSSGPVGEKWWHRLFVLTGGDSETTPLFHVQGRSWRVIWHNLDLPGKEHEKNSALFLRAFPKDDTIPQEICSQVGPGGETAMLVGPGNFYLKIEASGGMWALTVEDLITDPPVNKQ